MKNIENLQLNKKSGSIDFNSLFSDGILLSLIFSVIFIIAKITGFEKIVWLRFINYLFFFPVAYAAIKRVYKADETLSYFSGLAVGFLTCLFGQLIYAFLFYIYLHFDHPFLVFLSSQMPAGFLYPELSLAFILFSEGLAWSAVTAFSLMQIFKRKSGRWAVHS